MRTLGRETAGASDVGCRVRHPGSNRLGLLARIALAVLVIPAMLPGCASRDWTGKLPGDAGFDRPMGQLTAADYYQRGKAQFAANQIGLAAYSFHAALLRDGKSVGALNGLGASYDRLKRFVLARRYYDRALKIAPNSALTLNNIGYSLLLQGRYDKATEYFRRAKAQSKAKSKSDGTISANLKLADRLSKAARSGSGGLGKEAASVEHLRKNNTNVRPELPPAIIRGAWVERTTRRVQTLVMAPSPKFLALARKLRVDPRMASIRHGRRGRGPAPIRFDLISIGSASRDTEQWIRKIMTPSGPLEGSALYFRRYLRESFKIERPRILTALNTLVTCRVAELDRAIEPCM